MRRVLTLHSKLAEAACTNLAELAEMRTADRLRSYQVPHKHCTDYSWICCTGHPLPNGGCCYGFQLLIAVHSWCGCAQTLLGMRSVPC